jgi:hypothetical protein
MKIIVRRLCGFCAAVAILFAANGVLSVARAIPALAAGPVVPEFCQTSNGSFCLNDWNGGASGNAVKMFGGNTTNEAFVAQYTGRCGGRVTGSCPFANSVFDNRYFGFPIVQLLYQPNGLCVATDSARLAVLGKCNDPGSGFGGGNGTLFVDHNGFMISLYWTNQGLYGNNAACMSGQSANGGAVSLALETTLGCPVWNFGLGESTNFDWAHWVLHDGSWPQSGNNITVITEWMTSEEPTSNWFNRDNPLNNGFGCGGGSGLGTCPNLFAAAQFVVDNLQGSPADYGAIVSDLAASASPSTTARAICNSPWASSHYNNCTAFYTGPVSTVPAPASDW